MTEYQIRETSHSTWEVEDENGNIYFVFLKKTDRGVDLVCSCKRYETGKICEHILKIKRFLKDKI